MPSRARREALTDALTFRATRRARFPKAAEREVPLEIFEGLAEYTGMRLAGFSSELVVEAVAARREQDTGFVRSFANVSGPLYGFLLDGTEVDWRKGMRAETDIGEVLAEFLEISPRSADEAPGRAESYQGAALRLAEADRDRKRLARLAAWRESLIDSPVLIVDLKAVTSGTFDPDQVFPFGEKQAVYTSRKLIAEWGMLAVVDGAILEDEDTGEAHVSLSGAAADFSRGRAWTLELSEGWTIIPAERTGDLMVRKNTIR